MHIRIDRNRLLQRFIRYAQVDTTARDDTDDYPSSTGQHELGEMLRDELAALQLSDVRRDEHGLVHATLSASESSAGATVVLNAHLDTSPETTGRGVRPQIIEGYQGGDIVLPADPSRVIRVDENPELDRLHGKTLITTDGSTLLGADDKAGLAVIMEAVSLLVENPSHPRCRLRVLFTCDEEIGRGVDHVDVPSLGGTVAYTLDGQGAGEIDAATFSADLATVVIRGVNIHPAIAKDRLVNAVRAAASLVDSLPRDLLAPEVTEGDEGFLHPYTIEGGVAETKVKILLRDFHTPKLETYAARLRDLADKAMRDFPGTEITVDVKKQYRNLADGLAGEPRAVALAEEAIRAVGLTPRITSIRGGTDGSQLTERGLPTPNLSTGQHNPHSPLEWACLDEMVAAVEVVLSLAERWAREPHAPPAV